VLTLVIMIERDVTFYSSFYRKGLKQ